jgi:hypothetical protein
MVGPIVELDHPGGRGRLGDRLGTIGQLLGFLDALVTKNRLKALAGVGVS